MRLKRHPSGIIPQIRVFECPECGTKTTCTKAKGRTYPGHVKNLYCFVCRKDVQQTQIE